MAAKQLPAQIKRLDENVVNRIAAGEVIQRPANGLKELLENSLDAGSTSIGVVVARGGLQLLQITDNGTGIRKEDLSIVCERFTTSKLKEFSDLNSIRTFGFRGEALASISHVAKLTILTKTADSACGFKVEYRDGKPLDPKPKPCAGNQGTQITVQDLFYNVPTRLRVLKSPADEFNRISEVMTKYAVHNSGVGFSLKRASADSAAGGEIRTQAASDVRTNISALYGSAVAKELLDFNMDESNTQLKFKASGLVTNPNFSSKKLVFLLFINNRLVGSGSLKRALDLVYAAYLPKGSHPFVYLSLEVEPSHVDVNVHPTKHEVHFLNQDEIVDKVQKGLDETLRSCNSSRTFKAQAVIPGAPLPKTLDPGVEQKEAPKNLVRTDAKDQKLDKFFTPKPDVTTSEHKPKDAVSERESIQTPDTKRRRDVKLASVKKLRDRISLNGDEKLRELIANHTFVGCVDREFALLQHETKLFIASTPMLTQHLFYQIVLDDFANFDALRLEPPVPIDQLGLLALEQKESGWTEGDGTKSELSGFMVKLLKNKAAMLDDYFSIEIDDDGNLCTVPLLLPDYVPFFGKLPMFLVRLCTEVNWDSEMECLAGVAKEVARFYSISKDGESYYDVDQHRRQGGGDDRWKRVIEHNLYPTMKKILKIPKTCLEDNTFTQVANLPDLYKVFERC